MRQARFEHSTKCGALVFHCDLRERVFERDIFRLGTATTVSPSMHPGGGIGQLLRRHDPCGTAP